MLNLSIFLSLHTFINCVSQENPGILIVSFDGFRYDYINDKQTPHLERLKTKGAFGSLINVFETKTFPNHQSLATGLYPESHGVLANSVYDPLYGKVLNYSKELWTYNEAVTPIWTLNELHHHHSGVMMWPGGELGYRGGIHPTFEQSWDTKWNWSLRVDTVISWMKHPETPVNVAMLYIEEPDLHSHPFSSNSTQVSEQIKKLDDFSGYLVQQLDRSNLTDSVNVFLLSDHGMATTDVDHIIDLSNFTDTNTYFSVGTSPVMHIFPNKGYEDKVYTDLKNASSHLPMQVYKLKDIPVRWHNTNTRRAPPIMVVADFGYAFQDLNDAIDTYAKNYHFKPTRDHKYGIHGYDNTLKQMHPFFLAFGPNIWSGVEVTPFNNVDLYSLWAYLLNIPESEAPSNGSFKTSSAFYILKVKNFDVPSTASCKCEVCKFMQNYPSYLR